MKRTHVQMLGTMALLLAAALLLPAGKAAAHAGYESSTPAQDEVVPAAPLQVDVYVTQDVFKVAGNNYVRVFAGDDLSTQISTGDGTVDDNNRRHISAALPAGLANGRYIVRWMTTSDEDGDTDDGAFCFYVGVQPTAAQQAECAAFAPTAAPTSAATEPASPAATQPAATAVPTSGDTGGGGGTSTGLIIGIVAGVIVAVVIVGGGGFWLMSRRS